MRQALHQRIEALMSKEPSPESKGDALGELFNDLRRHQRAQIAPYERMLAARSHHAGLPTDVFRFARIAAFPEPETTRTFRTSGTTNGARGQHHYRDLSLYDLGARIAARRMLFPDVDKMRLILLVAPEDQVPDSSLGYMLARFTEWFGSSHAYIWPADAVALADAINAAPNEPVALLGTSFAFVHVCDALTQRWALPSGSRIMQTGGFKGRSRTLDADAMRALLAETFGVPESHIVSEYGMTELSSQMYETSLVDALAGRTPAARHYWAPWWMRVTPVDATTLLPVEEPSAVGILRLEDAANLDSVSCLQTADRGTLVPGGFQLLGRETDAVPRGCSLAAEEALT